MRLISAILCSVLIGFGVGYKVNSEPERVVDTVRIVYPNLESVFNGLRNGDIVEVDRYEYEKASPIKLIRMDSIASVRATKQMQYQDSLNQEYKIRAIAHGKHCKCMDSLTNINH